MSVKPKDAVVQGGVAQTHVQDGDTHETLAAGHVKNAAAAGLDEARLTPGTTAVDEARLPPGTTAVDLGLTDEKGLRLTVDEMTEDQVRAHAAELEGLLHNLLRMGCSVYVEYKGQPIGDKYLRAVQLVGDEALRLRAEASGVRLSGRLTSASEA